VRSSIPLRNFALAIACVLIAGCGSGGGSKATAPVAGYSLVVTPPSAPTTLGTQVTIGVNLAATGGFAGTVALSASGVPASWGTAFTPSAIVDLSGGSGSATLTLTIPSNGAAAPSGIPVTIHGTATAGDRSGDASVTVANQYVISIAPGTGSGAHWGALTGTTLNLAVGATLVIRNDDSTPHRIHTSDTITGLPHQATSMTTGQAYTSGLLQAGTDGSVYCHDHGTGAGQFSVHVQ
jgi:hypothetical protein